MSLTNPNKPVTEQRLSEFYQQILPFLGGMPDILANKFSKADLYSTDEKMIGQWTDGKPLYQKTYSFTMPNNATDKVVTTLASECFVIDIQGVANWGTRSFIPISYCSNPSNDIYSFIYVDASSVKVVTSDTDLFSKPAWITIKYTKTTDSAISIGNDTDYSTTEKIIGTWIDGKPIYQKTIQSTLPNVSVNGTSATKDISLDVSVDSVVNINGIFRASNAWHSMSLVADGIYNSKPGVIRAAVRDNSSESPKNMLRLFSNLIDYNGKPCYITLQYTKTTD